MKFRTNDRVTFARDNYDDGSCRDILGRTGTVTHTDGRTVTVRLDGDTQSRGFDPDELDKH